MSRRGSNVFFSSFYGNIQNSYIVIFKISTNNSFFLFMLFSVFVLFCTCSSTSDRNCLSFADTWVPTRFHVGSVLLIFLVLCLVLCVFYYLGGGGGGLCFCVSFFLSSSCVQFFQCLMIVHSLLPFVIL